MIVAQIRTAVRKTRQMTLMARTRSSPTKRPRVTTHKKTLMTAAVNLNLKMRTIRDRSCRRARPSSGRLRKRLRKMQAVK